MRDARTFVTYSAACAAMESGSSTMRERSCFIIAERFRSSPGSDGYTRDAPEHTPAGGGRSPAGSPPRRLVGFFLTQPGGFVFRFFCHRPSMRFERANRAGFLCSKRPRVEALSRVVRLPPVRERQDDRQGTRSAIAARPFQPVVAHYVQVNAVAPPRFPGPSCPTGARGRAAPAVYPGAIQCPSDRAGAASPARATRSATPP